MIPFTLDDKKNNVTVVKCERALTPRRLQFRSKVNEDRVFA